MVVRPRAPAMAANIAVSVGEPNRTLRSIIDGRPHMSRICTSGTLAILALAVLIFGLTAINPVLAVIGRLDIAAKIAAIDLGNRCRMA